MQHADSSFMKSDMMGDDDLNPSDDYVTLSTKKVRCMNYVVVIWLSTAQINLNLTFAHAGVANSRSLSSSYIFK